MDKCEEEDCEHDAHRGFTLCGKHLGWGQDNWDEEDPTMCPNHPDKYTCEGYIYCGYCLGYGISCLDPPEWH